MAKKKTTKFQTYPQTYQFGGLPFLDQYQKLGNQWDSFWRGGNYFDGGSMLSNTVNTNEKWSTANPMDNTTGLGTSPHGTAITPNDKGWTYVGPAFDGKHFWKDQSGNQVIDNYDATWYNNQQATGGSQNQPIINQGKSDGLKSSVAGVFSGLNYINAYEPPEKINTVKGTKGVMYQQGGTVEPFKAYGLTDSPMMRRNGALPPEPGSNFARWENPRQAYTAVNELLFSGGSKIYKPNMKVSDALKKYTGGDYGNKILGNKKLKELTQIERDSLTQFIMQKENAASQHAMFDPIYNPDKAAGPSLMNYQVTSRADGGNINMEGYTPGTPSMENPMNEIPSGNITMEETPIPLLAIGKKGADNGLIKILEPNSKGYNFKSKSTVEIPLEQQSKEQQMTPIAKYGRPLPYAQSGLNIASMFSNFNPQVDPQTAYLNQISGGDPSSIEHFSRATPEFNQRMLQGYNQAQPSQVIPQTGMMIPNNGLFPQQAAYTQALPGDTTGYNPNNFKIKKGGTQKVAEYQKMLREKGYDIEIDGAWGPKTKAAYEDFIGKKAPSKAAVQTGKAKVANNIIKAAGNTLTGSSRAGINPQYLAESGPQGMQLAYDPITGQETLISTGGIPTPTPQINSPFSFSGAAGFGNPAGSLANNTMQSSNLTGSYNNPSATSYLNNRAMGVYAPGNNNIKGNPIDYPSISQQKGETESRAFGLLKMTPTEAANYDASFNKLAPTVKNSPSYLKVLDQERQQLGSKINKLNSEINSMKPGVSTTDWQRKNREIKQKELQELQQELVKVETIYSKKEKQFNSPTTTRYGKPRTKRNEVNPKLFGKDVDPRLNKFLNNIGLYQYGGEVPKFQFGGSVNDEHATPIFSSNLEDFGLTELQTEKDEIAFMPDGSIVDVKAKELHKKQDKHNVSDIMQSGTYVFSNDPKMKFGIKSKIGGVELGDMKLGKSVFKYKENEISPGPEDIMLKDMFFNGSKKELTTANIAKNVKKNLPIVDLKNDYFADRAIAENKDQRMEYLSVLKAFNEYKKPKQRTIPKAQYGMPIQPTQNGLDGVMGYGDKQMDPFKKMDNNMLSMFNYKQPPLPALPKIYEDGGAVEQAQLGKLLRYTVPGAYFASEWIGNNKKKKQERENARLSAEAQGYRDQLQQGVDRSGALGVGTNIASYAAALNVPLQRYDDQSEQMSLYNAAANRAAQRLEASKYTASQGIGGASSLARYSNPTNYGDFLAKTQAQSDSSIGRINQAIADLDMQRANANVGFISARNAGRNQSLNSRDTQVYNANVQGIGNVGRSAQEATFNSADTRYRMGNEKMAYDAYLKDKAQAAKDKVTQDWEGSLDTLGQIGLTAATGGFGNLGGGGNKGGQAGGGFNPGAFNWQNPNQQFQQSPNNGLFQNTYPNFPTYSTMIPGGTVNRGPLTWDPVTGTWR